MNALLRRSALALLLGLGSPTLATAAAQQRASVLTPGTGSISGHVVAVDTGKPLRHALVEIIIYGPSAGRLLFGRIAQTTTDDLGKFTFDKLPAGLYRIAAQAAGYVRMEYGQQQPGPATNSNMERTIELTDGQLFAAADFSLTHFNAIEGRLTDEFGDPAPDVLVQVSEVQYLRWSTSADARHARPLGRPGPAHR